ncbi:hypothetical protein CAL7716_085150 [Calothrix sp. PCC 7716]|nr:hypothetical protein CAL7716_085150 [Calothrix sp. PCC 7716]
MSKPDYKTMSEVNLRAYVVQNPDDQEAFYAYVDRVNDDYPNRTPMSPENAVTELQRRMAQENEAGAVSTIPVSIFEQTVSEETISERNTSQ